MLSVWTSLKGGHLDFSHLTELKNIYITEIFIYSKKKKKKKKKPIQTLIIKNHKIPNFFFRWYSLKRLRSLLS